MTVIIALILCFIGYELSILNINLKVLAEYIINKKR